MQFIKQRYLLYPVIFTALLFLVDKIFLIPEVRDRFVQPGGMLYYGQRRLQIDRYHKEYPDIKGKFKSVVVFGDSRSFAIGNSMLKFHPKLQNRPEEWVIYNFAGPQAVPAYYAYLSEKLMHPQTAPDYLLIGASPDAFNRNSGMLGSPVLTFGVDGAFIQKYRSLIPKHDYEVYEDSRRYALTGIQFSLKSLFQRIGGSLRDDESNNKHIPPEYRALIASGGVATLPPHLKAVVELALSASSENLKHYSLEESPRRHVLDLDRGAQYVWFGSMSKDKLKEETDRISSLYLKNYRVSPEEFEFFRMTLRRARMSGTKVLVFLPKVNPYLYEVYQKEESISLLWKEIVRVTKEEGGEAIDLNREPQADCATYYDASHLSTSCFLDITFFLTEKLKTLR